MAKQLTYLDFTEASKKSLDLAKATNKTQFISIENALGKILAKDIVCKKSLPAFNNSAMDGFAYASKDAQKPLKIVSTIYAGDKNIKPCLRENECYKIMTGAKVPNDADTIAPIEKCRVDGEKINPPLELKKGANLRLKGEEAMEGNILLRKGEVLNSSAIALLATQGIVKVEVYCPLKIAVLSTGNELKEPWEQSDEEEIYNCNSYAIISLLKEHGFEAEYCGVVPDNLPKSVELIKNYKNYDVIITSGGISFGDADFMHEAFLQNGLEVAFHGVNIKPGRPIMMGKMKETFVICLPGNPLTAVVNMRLFGINILTKMQGAKSYYHDVLLAKNAKEFKVKNGRVNVVLGKLENGFFKATKDNKYGSGMVSLLCEANTLLVTDENTSQIKENQEVFLIGFNSELRDEKINIFNR